MTESTEPKPKRDRNQWKREFKAAIYDVQTKLDDAERRIKREIATCFLITCALIVAETIIIIAMR